MVLVHYAGVGCEMDAVANIAGRHNVAVVEDNAHGLFGAFRGRKLGTFGQLATGTLLLVAMSGTAFLASLRVGRTFDYFAPLAVLFSAAALSPWIVKNRRTLIDASAVATVIMVLCGFNAWWHAKPSEERRRPAASAVWRSIFGRTAPRRSLSTHNGNSTRFFTSGIPEEF
jgi:hypothetical protein